MIALLRRWWQWRRLYRACDEWRRPTKLRLDTVRWAKVRRQGAKVARGLIKW